MFLYNFVVARAGSVFKKSTALAFRPQKFNVGWGFEAGVALEINQLQNASKLTIKIFNC